MFDIKARTAMWLVCVAMAGAAPRASDLAEATEGYAAGDVPSGESLHVIAAGSSSAADTPFVAIVRDERTYAALRQVIMTLPELRSDFFKLHTIVAAFLGNRSAAGHDVKVTRGAEGVVRLSETASAEGLASAAAPRSPFRVVAVPMKSRTPLHSGTLRLELDRTWTKAMKIYDLKEGQFTSRGGLAGRTEQFKLQGKVQVLRLGPVITLALDLRSAPGSRRLRSIATGISDDTGSFQLARLDGGGLIGSPNGGLRATGRCSADARRLELILEPLPADVADGFEGRGTLEALLGR